MCGTMLFHVVQVAELSSLTKFLSLEGMIAGRMELIVFWVIFITVLEKIIEKL